MATTTILLPDHLIAAARQAAHASGRSLSEQIEHWVRIGKIAEQYPEFDFKMIQDMLAAQKAADEWLSKQRR